MVKPDRDVLLAKLSTIHRCLRRIEYAKTLPSFSVDAEDIIHLNLERAIQAAIDMAFHVVAVRSLPLPDSNAAVFSILASEADLPQELSERLKKMVGFRNLAVHAYRELDPGIVRSIVEKHLVDLETFGSYVATNILSE